MAFKPSDAFGGEETAEEESAEPTDYGSLFAEDEGMGDPLMDALKGAGYDVTPDQISQIKGILEGGKETKPFGGKETPEEEASEAGSRPAGQNPFA